MPDHTLDSLRRDAVRDHGPEPLLTFYDLGTGERVELSRTTADNWVAKTANLVTDLGIGPGDSIGIDLPPHWQSAVWLMAAWACGLVVTTGPAPVDLAVTSPASAGSQHSSEVVVCSLRPLGLPCDGELPPGAVDYALEVRSQADRFTGPPPGSDDLARDDDSHADLIGRARADAEARSLPARPRLLLAGGGLPLEAALPLALVTAGSLVIVRGAAGPGADPLDRVAAEERVTSRL